MNGLRAVWQRTFKVQLGLLILVVFATGFVLGSQYSIGLAQSTNDSVSAEDEAAFEAFWQVYRLIKFEYIDQIERAKLVDGAISGMVDALGDQFSGYMDAEIYPLINSDLSGEIDGIGVVIRTIEETNEIEIVNILKGTPAQAAGVKIGDIFIAVNGEEVIGFNQLELAGKVRGPAGTEVVITFKRGDEMIDLTMTRAHIAIPNIESKVLEGDIGYIKLYEFTDQARHQIDQALTGLKVNDLNGLILDLRGNPGGLLSSAINVGSAFIKEGVILYEDFGDGREQVFNADGSYSDIIVPIVVLVDETSASASELIAGALQDRNVATIIGETTFGKGTVQSWHGLVNGGGVRLTIARWLTPDRHWIHDQGVTPDISVEWNPEDPNDPNDLQIEAALDYFGSLVEATE
jgi:carboxyl-terminal processing protease